MLHFSFEEQADLVWQFLCSIPVNLMEKFLPWLATSLTQEERQQMTACLEEIVPEEQLLQQVGGKFSIAIVLNVFLSAA